MEGSLIQKQLYVHHAGPSLLETPLLNKGNAFSEAERVAFNLTGLLPPRYETIEEQAERAYMQYSSFSDPINKHIYLRSIQDNNETLFYKLVQDNIDEMIPIIYTPTVGDACEQFSDIYRSSRGLFISHKDRHHIDDILRNAIKRHVKIIVVTDGERVQGLGDQGIGGMGIPIGKLSLYSACGGISPAYTLPVMLDVGTNNERLLADSNYMGSRQKRIPQEDYDEFVDLFIQAANKRWPGVLIQFEDFAQPNASPLLSRYRHRTCCFNDDIQGTAAVALGSILAACHSINVELSDQRILLVGSGSAGCGIAEHLIRKMSSEGINDSQARSQIYMVDRYGLLSEGMKGLRDFQVRLLQQRASLEGWNIEGEYASLLEVIEGARPTIMIGVSGQAGLFTEEVIRAIKQRCDLPIIFPLSNPSKQVEAHPEQIIEWTEGQAIIATGSPFDPIIYKGQQFHITQCNNSYIFPGIGLGVLAANARLVSDEMLMAASEALAFASPRVKQGTGALLPPLEEIPELSKKIAFAVGQAAQAQGLAPETSPDELLHSIKKNIWKPQYRPYRRVSS